MNLHTDLRQHTENKLYICHLINIMIEVTKNRFKWWVLAPCTH